MKHSCPICHKIVPSIPGQAGETIYYPFCCEQCKLIDLGKWLDAGYKVISNPQSRQSDIPAEISAIESGNQ